jgi:AraC-like DNA-binding protein
MLYREFAPPAPLDRVVHRVWLLAGRDAPGAPQPIVPDGRLELVLHLGEPFSRLAASGAATPQHAFLVSGQLTRPLTLLPSAEADVVGVRLHPLGAHALLGIPLDELADEVVPLDEVDRRLRAALLPAMASTGSPEERAHAIFAALGRLVSRMPCTRMARAAELLGRAAPPGIREVATEVGLPERTLLRRFRGEVGLAPNAFRRVARFRRAFALMGPASRDGLAGVAYRTGYCDQAHLIRDFRRFAGASPRAFLRANPALAQAFVSGADHY